MTVVCPDCGKPVKVGFRGPGNLVEHQGKKKCLKTIADEKKKTEANKIRTLHDFGSFNKRVVLPSAPSSSSSLVTAPPRVVPLNSSPLQATNSPTVESPPSPTTPSFGPPKASTSSFTDTSAVSLSDKRNPLERLKAKAAMLPASVPMGHAEDAFSVALGELWNPDDTDELWEAADGALNRLIGYDATPELISQKIRRGQHGVDGVCDFIAHLRTSGISEDLLEGKMKKLEDALDIL